MDELEKRVTKLEQQFRVTKLEQQFEDFEKYQGGIVDQIRGEFSDRVKELTTFFEKQIALLKLGFDEYKRENRKFMFGLLSAVVILIIAAIVKGFLP